FLLFPDWSSNFGYLSILVPSRLHRKKTCLTLENISSFLFKTILSVFMSNFLAFQISFLVFQVNSQIVDTGGIEHVVQLIANMFEFFVNRAGVCFGTFLQSKAALRKKFFTVYCFYHFQ